ncbi:MAG TPA: hypothetical protein VF484_08760, partial [Candidatus Limnocylindrales bacterium]
MDLNWHPAAPEDDTSGAPEPTFPPADPPTAASPGAATTSSVTQATGSSRQGGSPAGRRRAVGAVGGALLVGGVAGAVLFGPALTAAQSPTSAPTTSGAPSTTGDSRPGPGGHQEAVSDASVAAKAIGISESDLTTALQGGQTMAAVAKAHNVDVQKVIDALVADAKDELAAAVKAGTLTQAQADAEQ